MSIFLDMSVIIPFMYTVHNLLLINCKTNWTAQIKINFENDYFFSACYT